MPVLFPAARCFESSVKQRRQLLTKLLAVMMPAPGIRKLDVETWPTGSRLSVSHDVPDRTNHNNDCFGIKLLNCSTRARLPASANKSSRPRFHAVDKLTAKIGEVAAERSKRFEEEAVTQVGKCFYKSLPCCSIDAGIRLAEEST